MRMEQVRISGFRNPLGLVHNAVVLQRRLIHYDNQGDGGGQVIKLTRQGRIVRLRWWGR